MVLIYLYEILIRSAICEGRIVQDRHAQQIPLRLAYAGVDNNLKAVRDNHAAVDAASLHFAAGKHGRDPSI
jgi:hypothetical protein